MKKESDNRMEMSRRGFLKAAALTGAAICVSPALEKVQAAERAVSGKSSVKDIPAGMAAVRKQRTLGSGQAAFIVSSVGEDAQRPGRRCDGRPSARSRTARQHALSDVGLEQRGGGGTDV